MGTVPIFLVKDQIKSDARSQRNSEILREPSSGQKEKKLGIGEAPKGVLTRFMWCRVFRLRLAETAGRQFGTYGQHALAERS
jgi:hypothetical protein